jgi:precorrin-6B methylase 2
MARQRAGGTGASVMRPPFSQDLVLQRAPNISIRLGAAESARISSDSGKIDSGAHALIVLDAFAQPTLVSDALAALQPRVVSKLAWMDLTDTLMRFYHAGILRARGEVEATFAHSASAFEASGIHVAMLGDRERTSSFLGAIRQLVEPGDVVVDLGTGTGILALEAARAGARQVYAIEATGIGRVAQRLWSFNGVGDRITLISGWSSRITLPERGDVLVSEIIGNEPFDERIIEFFSDARARLLKPGARLVPRKVRVHALPVQIPEEEVATHTFTVESLERWNEWYGMDLSSLRETVRRSFAGFMVPPHRAAAWRALSDPVLLAEVDLTQARDYAFERTFEVGIIEPGWLNGIIEYFELELSPSIQFSTHPRQASASSSWHSPVTLLPDAWQVEPGDPLRLTYRRAVAGARERLTVEPA